MPGRSPSSWIQLVGAPFEATLDSDSDGQITFRLELIDPVEGDTLFDDVDFLSLDPDSDGLVRIAPGVSHVEDAYNHVRRTFQTHDHWVFSHVE